MSRIVIAWRLLALACALTFLSDARAVIEAAGGRSYQSIVDRNPFGLRPPPTNNLPAAPTNQVAKSSVKLTGFTTIGERRASRRSIGFKQQIVDAVRTTGWRETA